ncbi:O-succinylbenzoic acid--CoA ligase [Lacihabitans sp. LS3-19]|uniref:AMP-binding protein n=1 Tax=Lacihabitans sp. LS3-19 TaxID=2487335 RepID=UPI0020CF2969|nr:AMP-binding protein [Lacihabitans sp. LS3-19]MCP9768712.1 O-succinylbenzoic acid--CoA ligase [Lacihabitans sp. LS3-19]
MLYISKDAEIINTESNNLYYKNAIDIYEKWQNGKIEFSIKTSGSTGKPKVIVLDRKRIEASIELTKNKFNLNEGDLFFCCLNIENIAGLMMMLRAFYLNAEVLIVEPSSQPFEKLKNLAYLLTNNRGRNFFAFVPLQLQNLIQNEGDLAILKTAKAILVGGAAVNEKLKKEVQEEYLPVFETYGMTETISHIATKDFRKNEDFFRILKGVSIEINEQNCLKIKAKSTGNEWIQTNDVVELKNKSSFILKGRIDNIINSGGLKIQLEEIERKISQNFDFKNRFFCFGIPDEKLGQKLILIMESKENILEKSQLSAIFTKFEVPKEIYFIEKFFETSSAKLDKLKIIHEILGS